MDSHKSFTTNLLLFVLTVCLCTLPQQAAAQTCYVLANGGNVNNRGLFLYGSLFAFGNQAFADIAAGVPRNFGGTILRSLSGSSICTLGGGAPDCQYDINIILCTGAGTTCSPGTEKLGRIFISGAGPAVRPVTGGTGDFAGASGSFVTDGSFNTRFIEPGSPEQFYSINAGIQICVSGSGAPPPTPAPVPGPPTPVPTPAPTRPPFNFPLPPELNLPPGTLIP